MGYNYSSALFVSLYSQVIVHRVSLRHLHAYFLLLVAPSTDPDHPTRYSPKSKEAVVDKGVSMFRNIYKALWHIRLSLALQLFFT